MKKLILLIAFSLLLPAGFARAGGGCFLAGTQVLTPEGTMVIENLTAGASVLSLDKDGSVVPALVRQVAIVERKGYFTLRTETTEVNVTAEHPLLTAGGWKEAKDLQIGDVLFVSKQGGIKREQVTSKEYVSLPVVVAYNLEVDEPHTFFANNIVAHNKGGGGGGGGFGVFGGGYSRVRSSSCKSGECSVNVDPNFGISIVAILLFSFLVVYSSKSYLPSGHKKVILITAVASVAVALGTGGLLALVILLVAGAASYGIGRQLKGHKGSGGWAMMDVPAPRSVIDKKAERAHRLLNFLAQQWKGWNERQMVQIVRSSFAAIQSAWEARDYTPCQGLMMLDVYKEHEEEVKAMIKRHEKNELRNLGIEDVRIIIVRNHANKKKNEFVVWISAHAQDVIVDDRTGKKIRGDNDVYPFEEFWTFSWALEGKWKLKEVTQVRQASKLLSEDNFDEESTPEQMKWYYEHDRAL
ncbi:TIM44-like domain-containing protein [archaeon]|nr:TIM44-like domain-containing protein [archaeon]